MKKLRVFVVLLSVVLVACAGPTTSIQEKPLTEEERFNLAVTNTYNDLRLMSEALKRYKAKFGNWPANESSAFKQLISEGFLEKIPEIKSEDYMSRSLTYRYDPSYDVMDGGKVMDTILWVGYFNDRFCNAFIADYASDIGNLKSEIFDYQANGRKYPGEVFGKNAILYALKFKTKHTDLCEIQWVLEYKE